MKTLAKTTIAAVALMGSFNAAQAGNAGAGLDECLLHVAAACDTARHPGACLEAGQNACEEYHGTAMAVPGIEQIRILQRPNGTYRVVLNGGRPAAGLDHENRDTEENRSDRADRGGSSGGGGNGGGGNGGGGGFSPVTDVKF